MMNTKTRFTIMVNFKNIQSVIITFCNFFLGNDFLPAYFTVLQFYHFITINIPKKCNASLRRLRGSRQCISFHCNEDNIYPRPSYIHQPGPFSEICQISSYISSIVLSVVSLYHLRQSVISSQLGHSSSVVQFQTGILPEPTQIIAVLRAGPVSRYDLILQELHDSTYLICFK